MSSELVNFILVSCTYRCAKCGTRYSPSDVWTVLSSSSFN